MRLIDHLRGRAELFPILGYKLLVAGIHLPVLDLCRFALLRSVHSIKIWY